MPTIASTDDKVVGYRQSTYLLGTLNKNKKDVGLVKLKISPHNPFYYKKDAELVYTEVENFLAKYLF